MILDKLGGNNLENKIHVTNEMAITLKVIGGKWKPLILHFLQYQGPKRFIDIVNYLGNAPKKTIIEQLKELERDQIIVRKVIKEKPLQVQYYISSHGQTLYPLLEQMCKWGYENKSSKYIIEHPICD